MVSFLANQAVILTPEEKHRIYLEEKDRLEAVDTATRLHAAARRRRGRWWLIAGVTLVLIGFLPSLSDRSRPSGRTESLSGLTGERKGGTSLARFNSMTPATHLSRAKDILTDPALRKEQLSAAFEHLEAVSRSSEGRTRACVRRAQKGPILEGVPSLGARKI